MSIEGIAERAGVGKTTIYRRWSCKEDLIKDALAHFQANHPLPDTGTIRNDLLSITKQARELFDHHPLMAKLITKIIAEIKTSPEVYRTFYETLVAPRMQLFRQMIQRAQQRGELRQDLDTTFLLSLIFSSLVYGNLFAELIDPDIRFVSEPEAVVDALLYGLGTACNHQKV